MGQAGPKDIGIYALRHKEITMKVAFFSVILNIHQARLADELYELTNHSFVFVELEKPESKNIKGGSEDFSTRPYLLQSWKNLDNEAKALDFARNSEIAVFGGYMSLRFQIERLKENRLTFEMGERWLKHWQSLFSPRLLKNIWDYHTRNWRHKPLYKLCSSAYAANDQYLFHTFIDRCYKWGYFTKVEKDFKVEALKLGASTSEITPLMWCGRFLKWKHPEIPVKLAYILKENGYRFVIDMYGEGVEFEKTKRLAKILQVDDVVCFKGNLPNQEILEAMRNHDIFLFTSDRHEGWGAVANEAMSNRCCLVASDEIGSTPFLLSNGENGMVFRSKSVDSLYKQVAYLLNHPEAREMMSEKGYHTMIDIWSPEQAARNFLELSNNLLTGNNLSITEGPCSKAFPYKHKRYE